MKISKRKYESKSYEKRASGEKLKTSRCDYCRNQACFYYRISSLFKKDNSESCTCFF